MARLHVCDRCGEEISKESWYSIEIHDPGSPVVVKDSCAYCLEFLVYDLDSDGNRKTPDE